MAKVIMVQGTMSNVGKSLIAAGLCRIFWQDGYRTAPFKSQNMALNSYVTAEGLEIGRAQAMQAEAAGIPPLSCMNPILLKPTSHTGSQVVVNGEPVGNMSAQEYFPYKKKLVPDIKNAFRKLAGMADVIVVEGAGSPAEINLKQDDIVNMGLAKMIGAPVLLVGDVDRGGVFAQLLGTLLLLEEEEKKRVKGLIVNKFRGDRTILDPGVAELERRGGIPAVGVVPYMELSLEAEDSLAGRFSGKTEADAAPYMELSLEAEDSLAGRFSGKKGAAVDIAVIRVPRISNFTDFHVFGQIPGVSVRYAASVRELGVPDLLFLPGSKNTMGDLGWMRQNGLEAAVKELAGKGVPIFGICGGYQMMGERISDPHGVEEGGEMAGMGLLPVATELRPQKERRQRKGVLNQVEGVFSCLSGRRFQGYEIHMGRTGRLHGGAARQKDGRGGSQGARDVWEEEKSLHGEASGRRPVPGGAARQKDGRDGSQRTRGVWEEEKGLLVGNGRNVCGTYVHGLFDAGSLARDLAGALAARKGISLGDGGCLDYQAFKEAQYEKLADTLREHLDMEAVYGMLEEACLE